MRTLKIFMLTIMKLSACISGFKGTLKRNESKNDGVACRPADSSVMRDEWTAFFLQVPLPKERSGVVCNMDY
jgi:hypothetical protein